jgi:hypothetical protein
MFIKIGTIGSGSELSLDAALFGGCEMTGFEFTPAFADLEEAEPFFAAHLPKSNKQAALEATNVDHNQGFEATLGAAVQSKK